MTISSVISNMGTTRLSTPSATKAKETPALPTEAEDTFTSATTSTDPQALKQHITSLEKDISALETQLAQKKAVLLKLKQQSIQAKKLASADEKKRDYQNTLQSLQQADSTSSLKTLSSLSDLYEKSLQYDDANGIALLSEAGFFKLYNQSFAQLAKNYKEGKVPKRLLEKIKLIGHTELVEPGLFVAAHQAKAKNCMQKLKELGVADQIPFEHYLDGHAMPIKYKNLDEYMAKVKE